MQDESPIIDKMILVAAAAARAALPNDDGGAMVKQCTTFTFGRGGTVPRDGEQPVLGCVLVKVARCTLVHDNLL